MYQMLCIIKIDKFNRIIVLYMAAFYTGRINCFGGRLLHDTRVRWLGTYALDQKPQLKHERRTNALIINTDKALKPGEHWLAFYAPRDSTKIMFSLFKLPPNFYC